MCPYTTILRSSSCNHASTCLMASMASPQCWCHKCTSMYKPDHTSDKTKLALDRRGDFLNFAAVKPFLPSKFLYNAIERDSPVDGILFLLALITQFKICLEQNITCFMCICFDYIEGTVLITQKEKWKKKIEQWSLRVHLFNSRWYTDYSGKGFNSSEFHMKRYKPLIKVEESKSQLYINYIDENEKSICSSWNVHNA